MGTVTDPVYRRVLEDLRAQIREGVLGPGARVPSRNAIIARYGVGETAAKHALQVLAAEGLIESRAGSGSFVRATPAPRHLEHDRPHFPGSPFGLPENRPGDGQQPAATLVSWEHQTDQVPAPRQAARRLRLPAGEPVVRTRYLLTADGSPVQVAVSYEPAALTAGTAVALPEEGPYAGRGVAERMRAIGVAVDHVVEDIAVRACVSEEAAALGIPPGAPVFAVSREHRAGALVAEVAEIVLAADRFRLRYRMPLPNGGPAPNGRPAAGPAALTAAPANHA